MGEYRILEHTADMGIEAVGETLDELLVQAARGMMEIISGAKASPREQKRVEVTAGEGGELLVNWLNEILFLFDPGGFFPAEFVIEQATENRVKARIAGEPFDRERHPIDREIKAATYHQLQFEHVEGKWQARVYLDL
jgi:SHS2 domain-containing protein